MNADNGSLLLLLALAFAALLRAASPIILASLGGLVSDLAGVVNVGLEGLMLTAAFFGVIGSAYAPQWLPGEAPWACLLVGAGLGLLAAVALALLLGLFHLEFGADLIVAGIGINMLASGLTVFLMVTWTGDKGSTASLPSLALPTLKVPLQSGLPWLDVLLNGDGGMGHHLLVYVAFMAVPALSLLLYRTRLGLQLRAIGENRDAALAAGIPVKKLQYVALALSGVLAGLGGLYLSMGYLTLFQADMAAGRGFLALAAVFLGARRPLGTLAAALLFGASSVLAAQLGLVNVPSQVVFMVPPVITILALVTFNRRRERRQRRQLNAAARAMQELPPSMPVRHANQ